MKTLMCSLAAVVSVALGSGTLAAAEETVITGIASDIKNGNMMITSGSERRPVMLVVSFPGLKPPKEGEKVRVHAHYMNDDPTKELIATKIEKVGRAEGGSKK